MQRTLCFLLTSLVVLSASVALGAPTRLVQQGRLLDGDGAALQGVQNLTFTLYDAETDGNVVWTEDLAPVLDDGYYSVTLGTVEPLDDLPTDGTSLWLEMAVGGVGLSPRQELLSVPYALEATSANHVDGGVVDAAEILVDGNLVVDSLGTWVGEPLDVSWDDLSDVPAELDDGDQDTLLDLSCLGGEIVSWDGTSWGCAIDIDTQLSEAEVDAFVGNNNYSLGDHTVDTLSALGCLGGEVARWDGVAWVCGIDIDTQLSEAE